MKRTMGTKHVLLTLFVLFCLVACGRDKDIPESLIGIKDVVTKLDSAVTSMYGWEPRDSTYNQTEAMVTDVLDQYYEDHPEHRQNEESSSDEQKTYDYARITWNEFKRLCDAEKYKEALTYYEGEGPNGKNLGDFLVYLKHSTHRYIFFSEVLRPMMAEYKGEDYALKEYIALLQLEKAVEDVCIDFQANGNGYIPEVYPYVLRDLGFGLAATGRIDETQGFFDDMAYALYGLTDDVLFANLNATKFTAELYILGRKNDRALAIWDDFKDYLEENASDYDADKLKECLHQIEVERAAMLSGR